ncbi:MAG: hypothetical protein KatS3mg057_2755 [Herpetosiphonaceae bacterium]|nr:MAG: hypothetical protein KatS3mg057_2755 [Herpetosiphonaceae bacterium]
MPVSNRLHWLAILTLIAISFPLGTARSISPVAEPFRDYYERIDGIRLLGYPLTGLMQVNGYAAQYFEKGRLEDHRHEVNDPNWAFMEGLLTIELMDRAPGMAVNNTSITYADLKAAADPSLRHAPPPGFTGGTRGVHDGMFIPFDPQLRPAPGYIVAPYFWAYMNRQDLFPTGWLHAFGLPISDTFTATTLKDGETRTIFMQAFERTVLTYDMRNPAGWQVERGNIGADMTKTLSGWVEQPGPNARVTLPLHILARVAEPGEVVYATLRWQDGTTLTRSFVTLRGEDMRGLMIDSLDWAPGTTPQHPPTQQATLELYNRVHGLMARQQITVVNPNDQETQEIEVYLVDGETVKPVKTRVARTPRIGAAAIEELLWGPPPTNPAGYTTALPTPWEVLSFHAREPDWGPRVTLLSLSIEDGVATANISQELRAYGGGSLRVMLIRQQISKTLLQFPGVREVRIAIEGETEEILQP